MVNREIQDKLIGGSGVKAGGTEQGVVIASFRVEA